MPAPEAALRHYARQQRLTLAAVSAARSSWARLNPNALDRSWLTIGPRLLVLTAGIQREAVTDSITYVPRVLDELEIDSPAAGRVAAAPFIGVASDGRSLESLLHEPLIRTKTLIGEGASTGEALRGGLVALERIIATQVADAGRAAVGVGIASRSRVGWVRMLSTPSCSRCAVLAGKFFRYNQGFARHPRCDCRHIPCTENIAGDLTTDPRKAIESGQVTGLSKADTRAILEDGADVGQVINAHRGMTAAGTIEGTTRRGFAGKRLQAAGTPTQRTRLGTVTRSDGSRRTMFETRATGRLRPEQIYQQAASRDEAIELLRRHGYLV